MSDSPDDYAVALVTTGSDEQAEQIARALVERRLAACVNILGDVCSIYRWQDKVQREGEKLLVIKTRKSLFPRLCETVRELHSYDVPEILLLPILDGEAEYVGWMAGELADGP